MACTTYKSIKIEFTEPTLKPANGYQVKWRVVGDANYTTLNPNPKTSPIVIPQVPVCANIEGTITAVSDGVYGDPVPFVIQRIESAGGNCSYYTITEPIGSDATSVFRYIPCGSTTPQTLTLTDEHVVTSGICADDSFGFIKVFGEGAVTKEGPCTTSNISKTQF